MTEKRLEDMTLDELRAEAEKVTVEPVVTEVVNERQPETQAATDTPQAQDDARDAEPEGETLEQIKARLEAAEKALRDTKAWGTRNAQEVARYRKEQEDAQRAAARPQILDANPDLADAVRYVQADDYARQRETSEQSQALWQDTVRAAIPDIDDLLADNSFMESLTDRAQQVDWTNPIIAIREINTEIRQRAMASAQTAQQNARAETKRSAASMPTGGSRQSIKPTTSDDDMLRKFQNMSDDEIAREARKIAMGQR